MKTKNKKYYINVSLLFIAFFASGCYYDQVAPVVVELPDEPLSYSLEIQPIFDAKCASCHNGTGVPLDLSSDVSYDALFSGNYIDKAEPDNSSLYTKIDAGGSMEQYTTATEKAIILKWIEQGAENN
jgi:hypothetical protein